MERFRAFLRIPSVSATGPRDGSYAAAAAWLERACAERVPPLRVRRVGGAAKPVLIATWRGSSSADGGGGGGSGGGGGAAAAPLPGLLFNAHYDVVPAEGARWRCDPFAAVRTADGRVYARGAQDMKCVCVQYLEALARLHARGWAPRRTVHLTFVPDEEVGGADGMMLLVTTPEWRAMQPLALALDEGLANPDNAFTVFYGERACWWVLVRATGPGAAEAVVRVCTRALEYRAQQRALLGGGGCAHAAAKKLGDVATVNLTMLRSNGGGSSATGGAGHGGAAASSSGGGSGAERTLPVPDAAEAGFDVRVPLGVDPADMRALLDAWCAEGARSSSGGGADTVQEHHVTSTDRAANRLWGVFVDALSAFDAPVVPEVFPAGTDSWVLRRLGVPALGFSPMRRTPVLLHEHDEWLGERAFMEGIDVYEALFQALSAA
ncbi:hypothetical protein JKP88DRAFT_294998, partial [Tribonema minus]